MKATLEFDLPKDEREFRLAVAAQEMAGCLSDVDNKLRAHLKHGHHEEAEHVMEQCRQMIAEVIRDE